MSSNDLFSLSQSQKRVWLTQNIYPYSQMYNIGGTVILNGYIDIQCQQVKQDARNITV